MYTVLKIWARIVLHPFEATFQKIEYLWVGWFGHFVVNIMAVLPLGQLPWVPPWCEGKWDTEPSYFISMLRSFFFKHIFMTKFVMKLAIVQFCVWRLVPLGLWLSLPLAHPVGVFPTAPIMLEYSPICLVSLGPVCVTSPDWLPVLVVNLQVKD